MIVKVTSYIRDKSAIRAKYKAKGTVRYIMHRPDQEGERVSRHLINEEGYLEKYGAYTVIDGAPKGTIFYRIAISPDPKKEDTNRDLDLWEITQKAMAHLKEKLNKDIQFIAAAHDDQTEDVRHVNALLLVPGRLTKEEFRTLPKLLKQAALAEAKLQRGDTGQEEQQQWRPLSAGFVFDQLPTVSRAETSTRPASLKVSCPSCGPSRPMWRLDDAIYKCPGCGTRYEISHSSGLQQEEARIHL